MTLTPLIRAVDQMDPQNPVGVSVSASRVVAAAMVGGTTSVIAGDKFANGALTGAFSRAFNEESKKGKLYSLLKSAKNPANGFLTRQEAEIGFYNAYDSEYLNSYGKELWGLVVDVNNKFYFTEYVELPEVAGRKFPILRAVGFPGQIVVASAVHTHLGSTRSEKFSPPDSQMAAGVHLGMRTSSGGAWELFQPKYTGSQIGTSICPGSSTSCLTPHPTYCKSTGKC